MSEDKRNYLLDESHERAVRRAISLATDDLVQHSRDHKIQEKNKTEIRFDSIEQRLNRLEAAKEYP